MKQLSSLSRRGCILVMTFVIQLVLCRNGVFAVNGTKACKLPTESWTERQVLDRLEPLVNKTFRTEITEGQETYTYMFRLCEYAGDLPDSSSKAGLIQVSKDNKTIPIGLYTSTQAIGGSDWVMLIYGDGQEYKTHCGGSKRKAIIMISCNKDAVVDKFEVVLEDRERNDCFYLFELDSSAVCPVVPSRLSAGSIILIIAFCFVAVYLIGGFLYQRLIVGAKGMEQFSNYSFWVEVGNLAADGCDFVCRSRNREEPPAYRGLNTDTVEEEPEERDDHLLPM